MLKIYYNEYFVMINLGVIFLFVYYIG